MAKLIWSPRALADLRGICDYIARDSERYASLFAERIVALVESIPEHPLLGAVVPEYRQQDLRERLFQNYRIVYRLRGEKVEIVTLVHAARLLPPTPPGQQPPAAPP
jgi:toxin ParE1/3/4